MSKTNNTESFEIQETALSSELTAFYCTYVTNTEYDADWWVSICKETILKDQTTGEELQLIGTKNIGYYPEKVYLDNFGDFHHFILYFAPIPKHWEVFDLMELDADNPFEYKNIQRNSTGIYQKRFN